MMESNLKRFAAVISTRWREPSACAACGGEFICGATLTGCWCSELKLSDDIRADLKSRYSGCLCRNCLEALAVGSAPTYKIGRKVGR